MYQVPTPSILPDDDDKPRHPPMKLPKKDKGKVRDIAPAPPAEPPVQRASHRQTPQLVPSPVLPQSPPVERSGVDVPRRSGREQKIPVHKGNVYGETRHTTEILRTL